STPRPWPRAGPWPAPTGRSPTPWPWPTSTPARPPGSWPRPRSTTPWPTPSSGCPAGSSSGPAPWPPPAPASGPARTRGPPRRTEPAFFRRCIRADARRLPVRGSELGAAPLLDRPPAGLDAGGVVLPGGEAVALEGEAVAEGEGGHRPVGVVEGHHRAGIAGGDVGGQPPGGGEQPVVGDDVVHEAEPVRLGGVDEVPGEAHLPGGVQPDPGVGVAEDGPLRGDEERALERELQATGDGRAVDRPDDGGVHGVEDPPHRVLGIDDVGRRQPPGARLLQVDPGAEGRVGPRQDDAVHVGVGLGGVEGLHQPPEQLRRQGVAGFGPVEREDADVVAGLGQEDGRHARHRTRQPETAAGRRSTSPRKPRTTSLKSGAASIIRPWPAPLSEISWAPGIRAATSAASAMVVSVSLDPQTTSVGTAMPASRAQSGAPRMASIWPSKPWAGCWRITGHRRLMNRPNVQAVRGPSRWGKARRAQA